MQGFMLSVVTDGTTKLAGNKRNEKVCIVLLASCSLVEARHSDVNDKVTCLMEVYSPNE